VCFMHVKLKFKIQRRSYCQYWGRRTVGFRSQTDGRNNRWPFFTISFVGRKIEVRLCLPMPCHSTTRGSTSLLAWWSIRKIGYRTLQRTSQAPLKPYIMSSTDTEEPRDGAIVVVAKCPVPGNGKTRLIPLLGLCDLAMLAKAMLSDVLLTLENP
jgi:hypothetical protein